jgi:uncharacterized membrane protein (GlpM family)
MNFQHIFFRSILGGCIIALVVFLSKTLGNIWGGLFAVFPAVFTSTFVIYYHLHGKAVIPAVAKSVFFPGSVGFILYTWVATLTFPEIGIWLGTLACYVAYIMFAYAYLLGKSWVALRLKNR